MALQTALRILEPDITVCDMKGKLNLGTNLTFLEIEIRKLIECGTRKLILDVAELDYIDSAGIGMFVGTSGLLEQAGGRLLIAGAKGAVASTFKMVHLHRIVDLHPDVDSAVKGFSAPATGASAS